MSKKQINVQGHEISVLLGNNDEDFISLTDMAKYKEGEFYVSDWIRNTDTLDYLGTWEALNNPNFNYGEFTIIRNESGGRAYRISVKDWVKRTNAIGIKSRTGRYGGGTYAHKDIAFHFGMWLSPSFHLYVVKEFQRLKEAESNPLALKWDLNRLLTKANYHLHTDAVKELFVVPNPSISKRKQQLLYANEADMLNLSVFGYTAEEWKEANPKLATRFNMRDTATINELVVMSNVESMNAELIKRGIKDIKDRFPILHKMAKEQLRSLEAFKLEHKFRRILPDSKSNESSKKIE